MAEPDPVAVLAAQVAELRGQLARCQATTAQLAARLEAEAEGPGPGMTALLKVKQLGERLDEATAKRQAADPPAPFWLGLSEEEHAARAGEVREWVERVALAQWPGYMARLAPCWANHPEAVQELSNLMTEWARIYGDPGNRPLEDALWFFERWLPGALSRLAQSVKCDVAGCRLARSSPWERSPPRHP